MSGIEVSRTRTLSVVTGLLRKTLPKETQATILNCLIGCGHDDKLTGHECDVGEELFSMLNESCDEDVIQMAQEM